jgi:hypothetical protein
MIKQVQGSPSSEACIDEINERTGKYGPYLLWSFKDSSNNRFVGFTESVVKPGNRTWVWLYGLLGVAHKEGDTVDFDSLRGTKCQILLNQKDSTVAMITRVGSGTAAPISEEPPQQAVPDQVVPESGDATGLFS